MRRFALTVDLEEYFQVSNLASVIPRVRWESLPRRAADSTRRLLDLFDQHQQRATFFTLGWVAERDPALLREIAARGHEIACHGYGHELVYALGAQAFRSDLRRAQRAIADATGAAVRGYRAPSYSITRASLFALEILAEEGFAYDSSIFPIRHHRYGIPDFALDPVRLSLAGGASLLEFPLTTLPFGRFRLPLAGGAYLRFLPPAIFEWGWRRIEQSGRAAVLYLHPWEIDALQPRQALNWLVRVNHYLNLARTESRVANLLSRFEFAPMGEVLHALEAAGRVQRCALIPGVLDPARPILQRARI
jgi:polysaccharide deacetylase family protein (PEP-CTERM system associated)